MEMKNNLCSLNRGCNYLRLTKVHAKVADAPLVIPHFLSGKGTMRFCMYSIVTITVKRVTIMQCQHYKGLDP